jgi:hypothetical protein
MICEDGINYSDSVGIKTIDEFYYLYSRDFEKAVSCYISERFGDWLKENKYHEELRVYNRLGMERNAGISMQNFLQILGYDVLPSIDARYLDGTLVINNTGRGLLYGSIRCPAEVETDKYEWETENGKALINLRGKGIISILSNGGCKKIFIDDANTLQMPILKKERKILLDRLLKNCQVVKGKADLPKVSVDNDFVSAYVNDEYDIRIKRNISLLDLIIKKLKKLETHSNMRIIYSDIIYYYKIILV